jgi:hypothetical protein
MSEETKMALLDNASVQFRTNDDDKDHDTNVTIEVRDKIGHLVARVSDTFGPFHDQTSSGPFALEVLNKVDSSRLEGGKVLIRIDPKGNDTWRFNFLVELHMDDGSVLNASADGVELNEGTEQQQEFGIV